VSRPSGVWIGLNDGDSWFAEQAVEEGANHATTQALVELVRLTKELIDSASARICVFQAIVDGVSG